ncbi:hypothetical protein AA0X95_16555 [Bacillus sp. 1P10SD]
MKFSYLVQVIEKALLPVFEIKESYLVLDEKDNRIVYQDAMQVAVRCNG